MSLTTLAFLTIPSSQAASIGNALSETLSSPNFSYEAKADLELSKGGEFDLPFDLRMTVSDRGGKSNGNLGRAGEVNLRMNNFSDIPASLGDFHSLQGDLSYRMSILNNGSVNYAEVTEASLTTDSKEGAKITGMLNQFAKFVTGRTFRFSGEEIADLIKSESQMEVFGADQEFFLSLLTAGNSPDQLITAFGTLIDDLVLSGFLIDEVSAGSDRSQRRGLSTTETHHLRFGSTITQEGAQQFEKALLDFIRSLAPGLIGELLGIESMNTTVSDLNDFLQMANQVEFDLEISLARNVLQSIFFQIDLSPVGVPLTLHEEVNFDYSTGFEVYIPRDQSNIIDVNKIFEGMSAIARLSASSFDASSFDASDSTDWDTGLLDAHPGTYDLFDSIQAACPDYDDKACARREARNQLKWVRNQYTTADFIVLRRELNTMINSIYY